MSDIRIDPVGWGALALVGVVLSGFFVRSVVSAFRKPPESPPPLQRLSAFAVLSFLCGLGVLATLLAAVTLHFCQAYDVLLELHSEDVAHIALARLIVLYCTIAPALGAVGFALAARASVKEGAGSIRGKAFYRAGILMALLPGLALLLA